MSTLRTNALEGVDAKNSITIVAGAGNVTTTNVQEGVSKVWANLNGSGTIALRDSFNVSGTTDNGTGDYKYTFTNNMNNENFAFTSSAAYVNGDNTSVLLSTLKNESSYTTAINTSDINIQASGPNDQNAFDAGCTTLQIDGDLA